MLEFLFRKKTKGFNFDLIVNSIENFSTVPIVMPFTEKYDLKLSNSTKNFKFTRSFTQRKMQNKFNTPKHPSPG